MYHLHRCISCLCSTLIESLISLRRQHNSWYCDPQQAAQLLFLETILNHMITAQPLGEWKEFYEHWILTLGSGTWDLILIRYEPFQWLPTKTETGSSHWAVKNNPVTSHFIYKTHVIKNLRKAIFFIFDNSNIKKKLDKAFRDLNLSFVESTAIFTKTMYFCDHKCCTGKSLWITICAPRI